MAVVVFTWVVAAVAVASACRAGRGRREFAPPGGRPGVKLRVASRPEFEPSESPLETRADDPVTPSEPEARFERPLDRKASALHLAIEYQRV